MTNSATVDRPTLLQNLEFAIDLLHKGNNLGESNIRLALDSGYGEGRDDCEAPSDGAPRRPSAFELSETILKLVQTNLGLHNQLNSNL
jgi:hypothetical protein